MRAILCTTVILSALTALGQDELEPGLVGSYRAIGTDTELKRIDRTLAFDWSDGRPDPRLPDGPYWVTWQGELLVQGQGEYTFFAFVAGTVRIWIDDQPVLQAVRNRPGWVRGRPVRLGLGFVPIRVAYAPAEDQAVLTVAWESDRFLLEPLGSRNLFHRPTDQLAQAEDLFARGESLVRALRCGACHDIPGLHHVLPAPALDHSLWGMEPRWLTAWLHSPRAVRPDATMPELGMSQEEVAAVASFLQVRARRRRPPGPAARGQARRGKQLFVLRGCAACHSADGLGHAGLFGGGTLDGIGSKRARNTLYMSLRLGPAQLNPDHRMPTPSLSDQEAADLAAYLSSLRVKLPATPVAVGADSDSGLATRLIEHYRCASCHRLAGFEQPGRIALPDHWAPARSCLVEPDADRGRPGYRLSTQDARAVVAFLRQVLAAGRRPLATAERGRRVWTQNNCAACHRRDGMGGYTARLDHGKLQTLGLSEPLRRGELSPPDLSGVGDKLHRAVLGNIIRGKGPRRRPWLQLHMPAFRISDQQLDALTKYLITTDRLPTPLPASRLRDAVHQLTGLGPSEAVSTARLLIGSRGFGCMACHSVGGRRPTGADPEARGPELVGLPHVVRREWFVRWLRDPTRISLGVEMPGIQLPVRNVLDGDLNRQVAALWTAFGRPDFQPPERTGAVIQILSARSEGRTLVLRDCMRNAPDGSGWCPRAFAIGFPNGVNVLIDLDTYTVRSIWLGELGKELTEHKTWLWEPAGVQLWHTLPQLPSVAVVDGNRLRWPERRGGQSVGRLRYWEHEARSRLRYAFALFLGRTEQVEVTETWESDESDAQRQRRLIRTVRLTRHAGRPAIVVDAALVARAGDRRLELATPLGTLAIVSHGTAWRQTTIAGQRGWWTEPVRPAKELRIEYRLPPYDIDRITDTLPSPLRVKSRAKPQSLPWIPGYRTIRLPLDDSVLPTCIGFLADGTPVVGSLRGGLFLARDQDGDGYPDRWQRYADLLAAPFGILAEADSLVVAHKPELIRLRDLDGDSFAERAEVIATGWGYTHDYHDWTFGVVRDQQGGYIVALGSDYQQRGRPRHASRYRGKALRISRSGEIEVLARGLRFPTGLAANRRGDVFFTDNQGVQNTFNELNHLVRRARYGVPSLYDPAPEKDPWPLMQPAVQIPHPWTRSVNGIAFLETANRAFGLHEGHLVGCEYDTRRLIRLTLYAADGTFRGACYPMSLDPTHHRPLLLSSWRKMLRRGVQPAPAPPEELAPLGPISCAVRSDGRLFVGSLRESGWGAGNNVGELLMIEPTGTLPPGIVDVRFQGRGLRVTFSRPLLAAAATNPGNYRVSSYTRIWRGSYATPDSNRRQEAILSATIANGGRSVLLELAEIRPDYVYELFVSPAVLGVAQLWPGEAYVTAPPKAASPAAASH